MLLTASLNKHHSRRERERERDPVRGASDATDQPAFLQEPLFRSVGKNWVENRAKVELSQTSCLWEGNIFCSKHENSLT